MPRVKQHSSWQWYSSFTDKTELELPDLEVELLVTYRIYCDELFCRAPGCTKVTKETNLNNLRKHYARVHPEITLTARAVGGRPTVEEENAAIEFSKSVREAYDARPEVYLTNARKIVRAAGGQVPCEECKDVDDPTGCVRLENKGHCENFQFFDIELTDHEALDQELDEMETDEEEVVA
ncbi:hypothetical protein N7488_012434 [Penicillium malachiteum]|nr:hypothetical protein N7488_012434 [Penicillium malachiteum]